MYQLLVFSPEFLEHLSLLSLSVKLLVYLKCSVSKGIIALSSTKQNMDFKIETWQKGVSKATPLDCRIIFNQTKTINHKNIFVKVTFFCSRALTHMPSSTGVRAVRKAFADFTTNPFNYLEWYQKADCVTVMLHTVA